MLKAIKFCKKKNKKILQSTNKTSILESQHEAHKFLELESQKKKMKPVHTPEKGIKTIVKINK